MNINLFLAENPNFKLVKATFPTHAKQYTYKTILDVEVGDTAVVKTVEGDLKCVQIEEVIPANETDLNFNYEIKWLVTVVDKKHYRECKEMEAELNKKLNAIRASKQRQQALEQMAEHYGQDSIEEVKKLVRL